MAAAAAGIPCGRHRDAPANGSGGLRRGVLAVRGTRISIRVPWPGFERIWTPPPLRRTAAAIADIPTPRPDTSVAVAAVVPVTKTTRRARRSSVREVGGGDAHRRGLRGELRDVDAAPVVLDLEFVVGLGLCDPDRDPAGFGLVAALALRLDAMIDRVADDVAQLADDRPEDLAVDPAALDHDRPLSRTSASRRTMPSSGASITARGGGACPAPRRSRHERRRRGERVEIARETRTLLDRRRLDAEHVDVRLQEPREATVDLVDRTRVEHRLLLDAVDQRR